MPDQKTPELPNDPIEGAPKGKTAKAGPKKAKSGKQAFTIPKLSETQWALAAGVAFLLLYGLYDVAFNSVPQQSNQSLRVPIQESTEETDEQKFKRENKNAKLPDGHEMSDEDIKEKTQLTQQVPFGDKELEFRVRLPRNWVMSEFARYGLPGEEKYAVLTNIARYFGPAIEDARPFLWVEAERQKRYMTAETWARAYMIKRGISPEAIKVKSPKEVQVLYVDVRDFRSYAVRTLFRVVGDTMVLVSFGAPVESYKEFKDIMGISLESFTILGTNDREVEEVKDYKLLNIIKFKYFASWLPRNEYNESTLRPSIELHNPQPVNNVNNDLLQGLILVNAWRKSSQYSPENSMKVLTDRLQELSMILKQPLEPPKAFPNRDSFVKIIQAPYIAQVNTYVRKDQFDIVKSEQSKTQQEVWITTMDNGYYVAYVTLITPVKATNYIVWAQNMAAYELMLETLDLKTAPTGEE